MAEAAAGSGDIAGFCRPISHSGLAVKAVGVAIAKGAPRIGSASSPLTCTPGSHRARKRPSPGRLRWSGFREQAGRIDEVRVIHAQHARLRVHRLDEVGQAAGIGGRGAARRGSRRTSAPDGARYRGTSPDRGGDSIEYRRAPVRPRFSSSSNRQFGFHRHQGDGVGDRRDRQDGVNVLLEEHLVGVLVQPTSATWPLANYATGQPGQLALGRAQRGTLATHLPGGPDAVRSGRRLERARTISPWRSSWRPASGFR